MAESALAGVINKNFTLSPSNTTRRGFSLAADDVRLILFPLYTEYTIGKTSVSLSPFSLFTLSPQLSFQGQLVPNANDGTFRGHFQRALLFGEESFHLEVSGLNLILLHFAKAFGISGGIFTFDLRGALKSGNITKLEGTFDLKDVIKGKATPPEVFQQLKLDKVLKEAVTFVGMPFPKSSVSGEIKFKDATLEGSNLRLKTALGSFHGNLAATQLNEKEPSYSIDGKVELSKEGKKMAGMFLPGVSNGVLDAATIRFKIVGSGIKSWKELQFKKES
jgi:hypothetical protein